MLLIKLDYLHFCGSFLLQKLQKTAFYCFMESEGQKYLLNFLVTLNVVHCLLFIFSSILTSTYIPE